MKVFVVIHTLRTYAHARGLPQSEHVAAHALTHNPALLVSCLLRLRPHDKLVSPDLTRMHAAAELSSWSLNLRWATWLDEMHGIISSLMS